MRRSGLAVMVMLTLAAAGCSSSSGSSGSSPKATATTVAGPPITVEVKNPQRCSVLATVSCLAPFPNDEFTVADKSTDTGRRVHFDQASMPATKEGVHVDPTEWNRNDGFSPGQAIIVDAPGVDLEASGATPITNIGASLRDPNAAVVVIDTATGKRQPVWAELDERSRKEGGETNPPILVRPAQNWAEGHRYVVAVRHLKDPTGKVLAPSPVFAAYRDGQPTTNDALEARRDHMEALFGSLDKSGVERNDLFLAWDFTVASQTNLTERVLAMREDAMAALGADGVPPHAITPTPADVTASADAKVVQGTFDVPLYLTGKGEPGSRLTQDPKGLPVRNGSYTATFTCVLPERTTDATKPARPGLGVVYGHGLLGDQGEVLGFGNYAQTHNSVLCAADWIGLAEQDVPTAVNILSDLSNMPELPDRVQQSFINFQYLARLLKSPQGFAKDPAFDGTLAPGDVAYWGRSQGGVFGGGATAISTEWTRAVLGEPGINYSTLLARSVDFDEYAKIQNKAYPEPRDWPLLFGLMQMLWDRGEANGYAAHITDDPLPGTPAHTVMLFEAYGDHQVTNVATEVEARVIGAKLKRPALADGRSPDKEPFWGIDPLPSLPGKGSVLYVWDFGTPTPPTTNQPNRAGDDPHDMDSDTPEALDVVAAFLPKDGKIIDACNAKPCTAKPITSG